MTSASVLPFSRAAELLADALQLDEGLTPFPWQRRLLTEFHQGQIPRSLDVPTGLGKTATIAIWLLARACGAAIPRRLVYVVDRRAVVDQATKVAEVLRQWVQDLPELRAALDLGERPLPISTLRGKFVDNREWMEDPSLASIIVGTVDMVGSRLLFEGYGTSRKMRPYQAALLGSDTLFALDEAHLVPPFERLIEAVAERRGGLGAMRAEQEELVPPLRMLSLSATGRKHEGTPFDLNLEDWEHPVARQRLTAHKRLVLHPAVPAKELANTVAQWAWERSEAGSLPIRCLIFTHRRSDAEAAHAALSKLAGLHKTKKCAEAAVDVELLVGGRRVFERAEAARRLEELGFLAGAAERPRAAFLFATSAGEVGVDLDADHMVCDLVAWERMIQRLGRVNRRGGGQARVEIVPATDDKASDEQLAQQQAQEAIIRALPALDGEGYEGSPQALSALRDRARQDLKLMTLVDAGTSPVPLHPALSRELLDAWSMTSLREHSGRPEVGPWLRGWVKDPPQTCLLWRQLVPLPRAPRFSASLLRRFFHAAPPHASELLETSTSQAFVWLRDRILRIDKLRHTRSPDAGNLPEKTDVVTFLLDRAGDFQKAWTLEQLAALFAGKTRQHKREQVALERDLEGHTLVVDRRLGGLRAGLLDARSDAPVTTLDATEAGWLDEERDGIRTVRFRVRTLPEGSAAVLEGNWRERERFAWKFQGDEVVTLLVVEKWRHDAATEDDRSAGRAQLLDEHQSWAEERAKRLARRLGLPASMRRVICTAARLHDEGKRAPRWQQAFHAPKTDDGDPLIYAKTPGPVNVHLLDGYRHEFGSLPVAQCDPGFRSLAPEQQELVLHLIAAHHGFARPHISRSGCQDAPPSALEARAREVALRFFNLQKRWGPWGLAWWEALLRAADQQASRDNDLPAGKQKGRGA